MADNNTVTVSRQPKHRRPRSGCRTCKARHLRCGEERPACSNCRKIKFLCPGYNDVQSSQPFVPVYMDVESFRRTFLFMPPRLPPLAQPSEMALGPDEYCALQFFQTQTLPLLCSIFPSELLQKSLLAVAHSAPAIMCLIIAISAYHQTRNSSRTNAWLQPDCIDSPNSVGLYALKKHAEALRLVRESISSNDPPIPIIKLACILFTVLELLRGSRITSVTHLVNGMNLLEKPHTSRQLDSFEKEVNWTLSRLSFMQSLYGRPRSALFPALEIVPIVAQGFCNTSFANVQEARTSMLCLSSSVFLFVRKVERIQTSPQTSDILAEQETLSSQLLQWSNKVDELAGTVSSTVDFRAISLLRVYHAIAFIFLDTVTTQYQTSFDRHIPMFRSVIETLELIVDGLLLSSEGPILFSLDLGIIPCLFYTAVKCRHPQLRRRAVSLLKKAPQREGLWDAREAAIVAERTIEFEERHVREGELEGCYSISEQARAQDVDIREADLDKKTSLCIVFRWRPYATCKKLEESFVYI